MWTYLRSKTYSAMYHWGLKTPPTPAELSVLFDQIERDTSIPSADSTDDDKLCDCQVLAGPNTVCCRPHITKRRCNLIAEWSPGLSVVPHELGSCSGMPKCRP